MIVLRGEPLTAARLFVIVGLACGLAFAFVTPPFQVPDEVGHYWTAVSIAAGTIVPRTAEGGRLAEIPETSRQLVFMMYRDTAGKPAVRIPREAFRAAWKIPPWPQTLAVGVTSYTPLVYLPQVAAAWIGRVAGARPLVTFYLGRVFSVAAFVALLTLAIRIAPALQWVLAAAGMLPMALFLAASWSADAMTIAVTYVFIACLANSEGREGWLPVAALLTALCKPAYFLIALLVFVIPSARLRRPVLTRLLVMAATLLGTVTALAFAAMSAPTSAPWADPAAQWACLRSTPLRFVHAFGADMLRRGADYVHQMVGRFGFLDVPLPLGVVWLEIMVLLVAALTAAGFGRWSRLLSFVVLTGTAAGIAMASYIGWSRPCALAIEGIQGRYFLPVIPLLLIAVSARLRPAERAAPWLIPTAAITATAVSLFTIATRYYGTI